MTWLPTASGILSQPPAIVTFVEAPFATIGAAIGLALLASGLTYWAMSAAWHRRIRQATQKLERAAAALGDGPQPPTVTTDFEQLIVGLSQQIEAAQGEILSARAKQVELDAILTSMVEGVLAVDLQQRILSINDAACDMLGVTQHVARNAALLEVTRNAELEELIRSVLESEQSREVEFRSFGESPRILRAQGAVLRQGDGSIHGVVVVLDDITRVKQLEIVRRDFVANVSHELKTPITSIKGYIETILDGAVVEKEEQLRFLQIVARQSDRLNAIIDDLLALAHLEQQSDEQEIRLQVQPIRPILEEAVELSHAVADEHKITLTAECDGAIRAAVNAPLLEQAITNLIDNACKYSPEGARVTLCASQTDTAVEIQVIDEGHGIEARHLPRLFERFYRVDRSRSRKLGGTGLGLAIVKHIAQAHHGSVDVVSKPGKGSTFAIRLPRAE